VDVQHRRVWFFARAPALPAAPRSRPLVLGAAVAATWLLWGSTPAGMRVAMTTFPPFVMATFRFAIAAVVIWLVAAALGRGRPTRAMLLHAAASAVVLVLLGNGLMTWSLQYLPTGVSALLMALSSVWFAGIEFAYARVVPRPTALAGMALGIVGIALLFAPRDLALLPLYPAAIGLLSGVFWAAGSALQRYHPPENAVLSTALQLGFGSVLFALEALVVGDWQRWNPHATTAASLGGLGWLVFSGSLISYPAFIYTTRNAPLALATSYAYVNPLVTIALGMLLFHERLSADESIAALAILAGVALMVIQKGQARREQATGRV
jgi:drug/metabolite transporter (DMT)-like permease